MSFNSRVNSVIMSCEFEFDLIQNLCDSPKATHFIVAVYG